MLPAEAAFLDANCFVVVDVLRATTTIATLFGRGMHSLTALENIDAARAAARTEDRILFGEVGGVKPDGFDFGNSPVDASTATVTGRDGALFTTNGTRALAQLATRGTVLAGALVNAQAVASAAAEFDRVAVVCAGGGGGTVWGLDDYAAAAVIFARLHRLAPHAVLDDASTLAVHLTKEAGWAKGSILSSHHAGVLRRLGLGPDVDFAAREDIYEVAPSGALVSAGVVSLR